METKDWLVPLAVSAFTTITTLYGAYWLQKWKDREKLHLHINWASCETRYEDSAFFPFVSCHNKSEKSVLVTDIRYVVGSFFRQSTQDSALYFDDENFDINYLPHLIAPNSVHAFRLDESSARELIVKINLIDHILDFLGRSRLSIQIKTSANTKVRSSAFRALPSQLRPNWAN